MLPPIALVMTTEPLEYDDIRWLLEHTISPNLAYHQAQPVAEQLIALHKNYRAGKVPTLPQLREFSVVTLRHPTPPHLAAPTQYLLDTGYFHTLSSVDDDLVSGHVIKDHHLKVMLSLFEQRVPNVQISRQSKSPSRPTG